MLLGLMSDNMLYLLKNRVNQSVEGINRELSQRDHNEISSFVDGGGGLSMNESNAKSIFEVWFFVYYYFCVFFCGI